ncbi:MAG: SDR family oxidoreductase [SAR324 cluster bacterium]|nr:SDR family oxidoreductase [SAR324 cluster bacterium]
MGTNARSDPGLMKDKVALVTGGARGNGFAIAKGMAEAGATLFIGDIAANISEIPYPLSGPDTLAQAEAALRRIHPRVYSIVFDVRDSNAVHRAVSWVEEETGGVDILVNNAGVIALNPLGSVSEAEWRVQLDVIVTGAFHCCRRVLPGMTAKGWGRIVNVASVAGHRGIGTGVAYTAAKHALIGLTRALAMEVAGQGITVNAVCPGTVATDLVRGLGAAMDLSPGEALRHFSARHPGGDPLAPEDVAAAALWLASDAARRVNGTSLFVDDGWHAH